jgi:pyruvate dehydrogenase E2 component (dihydrolipoamide acetyltransferase)
VLEWRVAPGDRVRRGDVVALVDTEKAEIEVECWDEGIVEEIAVPVGETVPVGAVLALLRGEDEAAAAPSAPTAPSVPVAAARPAAPAPPTPQPAPATRVRASPLARRLAAERGIDLASLAGSGPAGAITRADLVSAPAAAAPTASARATAMRSTIAAAMARVHLGFAVSLRGGGLIAPVLRDADRQSVAELMAGLRARVAGARAGRLRSSELSGATCTVTSLGEQGVDKVFGIIHPPQVALVGFGAIREQPWARDGAIAVRPVLTATLSADHRASDGQRGARFLGRVRSLLERPEEL